MFINLLQKESVLSRLCKKTKIIFPGTKVFVFQQDQINYHHKPSQRSYLTQTLIKTQKTIPNQRLDELFIAKQNLKSKNKNKIGLPPNKRYSLRPFS